MTCELSPLVYAELYALLLDKTAWTDTIEDRLAEGGLDTDWLRDVSEAYRVFWLSVSSDRPARLISDEHAHLASWILAALILKEPSDSFSDELRQRVLERYSADTGEEVGIPPEGVGVVVVAWTLTKVVGNFDVFLPVIPAVQPADDDIAAAYDGLVEHVGSLPGSTPWPEILGSSTHWRSAGIAESLSPSNPRNLAASIGQLVADARPHMPQNKHTVVANHWNKNGFVERRNVLTHVLSERGLAFASASTQVSDHQAVRPTVMGVTHFVCQRIAAELADPGNLPPWGTKWEVMQYEIAVW
jgi:hypothetical protein